jgi:hypothetical protein
VDEILVLGRLVEVDAAAALARLVASSTVEAVPETTTGSHNRPRVDLPEELGGRELLPRGSFSDVPAPRVLARLWSARATGILEVQTGGSTRSLHFRRGQIVLGRSSNPKHRLGEILLRSGAISEEEHAQAVAGQAPAGARRIGALLVAHGALTLKELHDGLVEQVRLIAADVAQAWEGTYTFLEGTPGTRDLVRAGPTPQLVLEACRQLRMQPEHLRHLPGDRDLLLRIWDETEVSATFALNGTERKVLSKLGPGTTLIDLLRTRGLDQEDVLRTVYAFVGLGVVQPLPGGEVPSRETSGQENFNDLKQEMDDAAPVASDSDGELARAYRQLKQDYATLEAENQELKAALAELKQQQVAEVTPGP